MKSLEPAHIMVVKPGWFSTVQDGGRYGYQQYGVSVSGAMDRRSFILANRLVGNRDHDAALELTLKGPELLFEHDSVVAVTGADLTPYVDGRDIPLWTSLLVKAGGRFTFGTKRRGARCYLAIAGGVDVPMVLGSRSTHIASQTGGVKGRVLAQGDVLVGGMPTPHQRATIGRHLPEPLRPIYLNGRHASHHLGSSTRVISPNRLSETLTTNAYRIASQSDRMGYRLEGPKIAHENRAQWISDGTAMGALQVPADEQPILLMADRQIDRRISKDCRRGFSGSSPRSTIVARRYPRVENDHPPRGTGGHEGRMEDVRPSHSSPKLSR